PAPRELHPLSLHDALPIWALGQDGLPPARPGLIDVHGPSQINAGHRPVRLDHEGHVAIAIGRRFRFRRRLLEAGMRVTQQVKEEDRKSTRLNSSHGSNSYA